MKKQIKKWSEMTKAEKRVALAKDVIEQINAKVFKPKCQDYVDEEKFDNLTKNNDEAVELQQLIPKVKNCEVCAKGGLFLAEILRNNKYKFEYGDLIEEEDTKTRLNKYFPTRQLDLIEAAFEKQIVNDYTDSFKKWNTDTYEYELKELGKKAIKFGKKYRSDKDRLIAIMTNIIENNGTFKP